MPDEYILLLFRDGCAEIPTKIGSRTYITYFNSEKKRKSCFFINVTN